MMKDIVVIIHDAKVQRKELENLMKILSHFSLPIIKIDVRGTIET